MPARQLLQCIPVLLIQCFCIAQFVDNQPVQYGLVDLVLGAMLLPEAVVGAANIGDPFAAFQVGTLAEHGSAAVLTAEKSTVAQDLLRGRGAYIQPFPLRQHHLRLFPQFRRDDRREIVFMAELFLSLIHI